MHMMTDLVCEDDLDFLRRETIQQRIAQNHASRRTQTGQIRIGLDRLLTHSHAIHALDRQPSALRDVLQT